MSESVIVDLNEAPDGVRTAFTTPVNYTAGTFRLIWNGVVYSPADPKYGWTEVDMITISTATAPKTGDVLQAFLNDYDSTTGTIPEVIGTPFDPTGALP